MILERHITNNDAQDCLARESEFVYRTIDTPNKYISFNNQEISGKIQHDGETSLIRINGTFNNYKNQMLEYIAAICN